MPAHSIASLAAKVSQCFGLTSAEVGEVLQAANQAMGAVGEAKQTQQAHPIKRNSKAPCGTTGIKGHMQGSSLYVALKRKLVVCGG